MPLTSTFDRGPLSADEARGTPADPPGLQVGGQARHDSTPTRTAASRGARGPVVRMRARQARPAPPNGRPVEPRASNQGGAPATLHAPGRDGQPLRRKVLGLGVSG